MPETSRRPTAPLRPAMAFIAGPATRSRADGGPAFEVTYSDVDSRAPVSGRVYVFLGPDRSRKEPRLGPDWFRPQPSLKIDRLVAPRRFPASDRIELVELRSAKLSAFHGREITHRAAVILPEDSIAPGRSREAADPLASTSHFSNRV